MSDKLGYCRVCGHTGDTELHHIVPRSRGGHDGPVVELCGFGNNLRDADGRLLCHGLAHAHRLHFKVECGELWFLLTPTPEKDVSGYDGWCRL